MSSVVTAGARSNLVMRVATAIVAVPLLLALLFVAPAWAFLILVLIVCVASAIELMAMTVPESRVLRAWGVIASLGVCVGLHVHGSEASDGSNVLYVLVVHLVLALLVGLAKAEPIERAAGRIGWLIAGPLYVGGLTSLIGALRFEPDGAAWALMTMILAWLGDTGGYFAGRAFGRHKLYEAVSPKKTIEGAIGGLAGSTAGAVVIHFVLLPRLPLFHAIALGLVGGAMGQAGDLCESLVKRACGVKDSGAIVPGHGGMLDRIDALLFTGATTWLYVQLVLH